MSAESEVDTACTQDFIIADERGLDLSKFPFTKEQFLENKPVVRSLEALGIDIEKFWMALLFVYNLTQNQTEQVMLLPASSFEQFQNFARYLHSHPDAQIRIWQGREHGVTIDSQGAIRMLAALLAENSAKLFDSLSNNVYFKMGDFSVKLKNCYKITFVVKCLFPFLEHFKEEDKRSSNPNKISYNLMLLISRIIYMFGYTDNKKFLDSDENIKGIWQRYKDEEWRVLGRNFY